MFVLGLSSGQSSSTDSLRAKKYFLRSSVISSEARHVCNRLLPFPLAYPAANIRIHSVCFAHHRTCISPTLPRSTLCGGAVVTTEKGKGGGERVG